MISVGARLQAWHHVHRGAEASPHEALLRWQEGAERQEREHPRRDRRGCGHHPSHRVWLLPVLAPGHPGHLQTHSLPRFLGRQQVMMIIAILTLLCNIDVQVWGGWVAAADLSAVPHLCEVHQVCLHPRPCLLCPPGGLQVQVPSRGEGVWPRRRWDQCHFVFIKTFHFN